MNGCVQNRWVCPQVSLDSICNAWNYHRAGVWRAADWIKFTLLVIKLTELCDTLSLTSFHTSVMNKVNDNYTVVHYRVTTWLRCTVTRQPVSDMNLQSQLWSTQTETSVLCVSTSSFTSLHIYDMCPLTVFLPPPDSILSTTEQLRIRNRPENLKTSHSFVAFLLFLL